MGNFFFLETRLKKMSPLHSFLNSHRIDKRGSHVSLFSPKANYMLRDEEMQTFWDLYTAFDGPKGLGEFSNDSILPVLVDVDLKKEATSGLQFFQDVHDPSGWRLFYSMEHVSILIRVYQKVLREILHDLEESHLICLLLEKRPYYCPATRGKTYMKNGFHLHFPFLFMNKVVHQNELIPRIRLELKKLRVEELPSVTNADNYIDEAYVRNAWLLYGSRKEGSEAYTVTCAFDQEARKIDDWQSTLSDYRLYDSHNKERIVVDPDNMDRFLPQILSIVVRHRDEYVYDIKNDLVPMPTASSPQKTADMLKMKKIVYPEDFEATTKLVDDMMACILDERADDRNDWMQIGWILYNIFQGGQDGLDRWLDFSRRSEKFDERVCHYEWDRMFKKDLTIGSLKYIAKRDTPARYQTALAEHTFPLLDKSLKLEGTHHDLAMVLFQRYESEFVCASLRFKQWYEFKNHIWEQIDGGHSLSAKISKELVMDYERMSTERLTQSRLRVIECEETDAREEKKRLEDQKKMIKRQIRNLKSNPFKTNVMKEAAEIFLSEAFQKKLDSNPYLIAFNNGVYNIKEHIFREGRPDDFISLKMSINYWADRYTEDSREVKEIFAFFEKIFPDREVREYFLDSASDVFIGGNFNKIVQIWTGEGDNGKSITQMIFEQMLGPYNVKLPTALITGKRTQSSAACPELVRAGNGVRMAMLQEPDKKDTINIGLLKELSGNDTFFARGLYKEGQEITPMFKIILICNEPPKITYSDKATWNRIKLIPFESTFTSDAPESYEEQLEQKRFPKDEQFKDKIPRMLEPLAWYLLHRLKTKPKTKKEPMKVTMATANYKKKNDVFKQFMDEWIEEREGKTCNSFDMYSSFREWYRESCPNGQCPDKNEFMDYFTRLWGPADTRGGWKDKYLRGPQDHN